MLTVLALAIALAAGDSTAPQPVLADSFAQYRTTDEVRAQFAVDRLYTVVTRPDLVELDTAVRFDGHATLRLRQPGGTAATPKLQIYLPRGRPLERMWLRATRIAMPPGSTRFAVAAGMAKPRLFAPR